MKTYIMLFVARKDSERIVEEIKITVDTENLLGVKEAFAMALEQEHHIPFRCVRVEEVQE